MKNLDEAYALLFPKPDTSKSETSKALEILEKFNTHTLGKRLALEVLCYILLNINFGSMTNQRNCISMAVSKLPEILELQKNVDEIEFSEEHITEISGMLERNFLLDEISKILNERLCRSKIITY